MANAVKKIRQTFIDKNEPLTFSQIRQFNPDLKPSEISMSICHLRKIRHISTTIVQSQVKGRKLVSLYTYHHTKLPKDQYASS
jgi:hypothetical protein